MPRTYCPSCHHYHGTPDGQWPTCLAIEYNDGGGAQRCCCLGARNQA